MDKGIDTGNILYQEKKEVNYTQSLEEFIENINNTASKIVRGFFSNYTDSRGDIQPNKENYWERLQVENGSSTKTLHSIYQELNNKELDEDH